MIFCTDTHFIHKFFNKFILDQIFFGKSLIIPNIKNKCP